MSYFRTSEGDATPARFGHSLNSGSFPALGERYVADDDEEEPPPRRSKPARAPKPVPTAANPDLGEAPETRRVWRSTPGFAEPPAAPSRCALDATAQAIIAAAQGPPATIDARARDTVRRIIATYFPTEAGKVSGVQFIESVPGLETISEGTGGSTRGLIRVGANFINGTVELHFARRVLQVGHELRHIDQWRAGMTGPARKAEREFLAHAWTATTPELPGTGCMQHATRVNIIDAALGNFNCLAPADRARHAPTASALNTLRTSEQRASGGAATPAPSTCMPSS